MMCCGFGNLPAGVERGHVLGVRLRQARCRGWSHGRTAEGAYASAGAMAPGAFIAGRVHRRHDCDAAVPAQNEEMVLRDGTAVVHRPADGAVPLPTRRRTVLDMKAEPVGPMDSSACPNQQSFSGCAAMTSSAAMLSGRVPFSLSKNSGFSSSPSLSRSPLARFTSMSVNRLPMGRKVT